MYRVILLSRSGDFSRRISCEFSNLHHFYIKHANTLEFQKAITCSHRWFKRRFEQRIHFFFFFLCYVDTHNAYIVGCAVYKLYHIIIYTGRAINFIFIFNGQFPFSSLPPVQILNSSKLINSTSDFGVACI